MTLALAVVIPCGAVGDLEATLASVRALDPAECVVVTGASLSRASLKALARFRADGGRVLEGAAATRGALTNLGVRTTTSPIVLVLWPGDVLAPAVLRGLERADLPGAQKAPPSGPAEGSPPAPLGLAEVFGGPRVVRAFSRAAFDVLEGFDEVLPAHEDLAFAADAVLSGQGEALTDVALAQRAPEDENPAARFAVQLGRRAALEEDAHRVLLAREREVLSMRAELHALRLRHGEVERTIGELKARVATSSRAIEASGAPALELGELRRLEPLSPFWGVERGQPVDRWYIERFLQRHRADIHGRVLEVKDSHYTRTFGLGVEAAEVLDLDPANVHAHVTADLARGAQLPVGLYDCFILTQTLHIIHDARAALGNALRLLKPGGVLLLSVPALSRVNPENGGLDGGDHWRFTAAALEALLAEHVPAECVELESWGNVLVGAAFWYGLASTELRPEELEHRDPMFPLVFTVRVRVPSARRTSSAAAGGAAVLAWHRVAEVEHDAFALAVRPRHFREQLEVLRARTGWLPLEALVERAHAGALGGRCVALTFDDGTVDALQTVSPLLSALDAPATFFVSAGSLDAAQEHWWDLLEALVHRGSPQVLTLPSVKGRWWSLRSPDDCALAAREVATLLREASPSAHAALWAEVLERLGPVPAPRERHRVMTAGELRVLAARPGVTIGSHAMTHPVLPRLPEAAQRQELTASRERLEALVGSPVRTLAYPYGAQAPATQSYARDASYTVAVTTEAGLVLGGTERLAVPRLLVPDCDGAAFSLWLDAAFGA